MPNPQEMREAGFVRRRAGRQAKMQIWEKPQTGERVILDEAGEETQIPDSSDESVAIDVLELKNRVRALETQLSSLKSARGGRS